ncbi:MAG: aldehyde dehydrogenase family protein, partial [Pseudohongiellaceae bacterium]
MTLTDTSLLRQQAWLEGRWSAADDGATMAVHNPATGVLLATVPSLGAGETRRAISAADSAQRAWRLLTGEQRGQLLRRWFELLMAAQEDLALIMTSEQGKPLAEARGEIAYAASYVEWFAEEARRSYGTLIPSPWPDKRLLVSKEPVGVCAAITPWNFPAAMITRKVAPALAAGCSMLVKPAAQTPLTAPAMAVLAERAGLPGGVLPVLTGPARVLG